MLDTTGVICTNTSSCSDFLLSEIGRRNLKGIIIIQDEARMEIEARTWVLIVNLKETSWVIDIVIVGDCDELRLLYMSKRIKIYEFGL